MFARDTSTTSAPIDASRNGLHFLLPWNRVALGTFLLLYAGAASVIVFKLLALRLPQQATEFVLVSLLVGSGGFTITAYAAFLSANAEMYARAALGNSRSVITGLTESQLLVRGVRSQYRQVLTEHLYTPVRDARERQEEIVKCKLLLSTPSYGYPPVGISEDFPGLSTVIDDLDHSIEIIFSTPDIHFYHWLAVMLSTVAREDGIYEFGQFADQIGRTLDCIKSRIGIPIKRSLQVWATNSSPLRMSFFSSTRDGCASSRAYIVLADTLNPATPISQFTGRCIGLPREWHDPLFLAPHSFFEEFQTCPYSSKQGQKASLRKNEFDLLKWDYILGRTRSLIMSPVEFSRVVTQFLASSEIQEVSRVDAVIKIRKAAADTIRGFELKQPSDRADKSRHALAEWFADSSDDETRRSSLDDLGKDGGLLYNLENSYAEHKDVMRLARKFVDKADNQLDLAIGLTYLLFSSGFGVSQFAMSRDGRA